MGCVEGCEVGGWGGGEGGGGKGGGAVGVGRIYLIVNEGGGGFEIVCVYSSYHTWESLHGSFWLTMLES